MQVEWFDALEDQGGAPDGAFQQSAPYAVAAGFAGARVARAVVRDGGSVVAWAQVLCRRGRRLVSRGPVWADDLPQSDRRQALRRLARQGAVTLVTPEAPLAGFGLVPLVTSRSCALWSLRPEPDVLRAGAQGKWRNRIVSAARRGVEIRPAGPAALRLLVESEAVQRRQRGYRSLPAGFSMALPEAALRLWQWHDGGQVRAAMCFVRHGAWATYHLGWADARARSVGAHGLMLWQAALSLRGEGVTTLDLGDVDTETAPGLARFKLGTGADVHRLGATSLVLPR